MALTKVIGDGLGAIPAISGASLTSLTSSQVDSGATTAKAWVNLNGTGTVAIRDSENVSSITDNSAGDYTVNFATAMANVNYSAVASGNQTRYIKSIDTIATDGFEINVRQNDTAGTFGDASIVTAIVMGDQA
tara:strand:+ start:27 stop:425 length:399 start_codon:yes stop_codon:yes gene_type:complete